jgi:hypothetical protein
LVPSARFEAQEPGLDAELAAAKGQQEGGQALMAIGGVAGVASLVSFAGAGLLTATAQTQVLGGAALTAMGSNQGQAALNSASGTMSQAQTAVVVGAVTAVISVACLSVGWGIAKAGEARQPSVEELELEEHLHARDRALRMAALRERVFGAPAVPAQVPAEGNAPAAPEPPAAAPPTPPRKPLAPPSDAPVQSAP